MTDRGEMAALGFRLKKKERAGAAMRRALAEDLETAEAMLQGGKLPFETRVHKVRRRLKRDRSLLRVFEPTAPELSRRLRVLLRDAGRELAGLRESHALAVAAANLGKEMDAQEEAILQAAVAPQSSGNAGHDDATTLATASELIGHARSLVCLLPSKRGERLYDKALRQAHKLAGKAQKQAVRSHATNDLHEWRKRLKDLKHLTQFGGSRLRRADHIFDDAKRAEELLGDDHDLAMLRSRVVKQGRTAAARFVSNVEIGGRRAKLQRQAFALGRKISRKRPPQLR
jgi:hypothetical protein